MQESAPKLASDVLRLLNAYHHLQYFATHGFVDEYALQVCIQRHLLTKKEAADLRGQSCSKGMRVLVWASQAVVASGLNETHTMQITNRILDLRGAFATIWSCACARARATAAHARDPTDSLFRSQTTIRCCRSRTRTG